MPNTNVFLFFLIITKVLESRKCSYTRWLAQLVCALFMNHQDNNIKNTLVENIK
jgi:hypothetical protein